jgi:hypothetical protein
MLLASTNPVQKRNKRKKKTEKEREKKPRQTSKHPPCSWPAPFPSWSYSPSCCVSLHSFSWALKPCGSRRANRPTKAKRTSKAKPQAKQTKRQKETEEHQTTPVPGGNRSFCARPRTPPSGPQSQPWALGYPLCPGTETQRPGYWPCPSGLAVRTAAPCLCATFCAISFRAAAACPTQPLRC